MRRRLSIRCLSVLVITILVLGELLVTRCWAQQPSESSSKQTAAETAAQQDTSNAATGSQPQDTPAAGQPATTDQQGTAQSPDKPGTANRLKKHLRDQVSSGCVNVIGQHCWDKPAKDDTKKSAEDAAAEQQPAANAQLPHSDDQDASGQTSGESSSRSTKIDLSPPPGEAPAFGAPSDVQEMKPWNPHKADNDVEVGDFYFKQKNYRAAESRYREALYWQDNHAIAMFRLAQTEERLAKFDEAEKNYSAYLTILPEGEFATKAKQGLERAKAKADQRAAEVSSKK